MASASLMAAVTRRTVTYGLPLAQAYAEANMRDAVRITRTTGERTFDRGTGRPAQAARVTVYEGPAHIYEVSGGGAYELGEEQQTSANTMVSIPLGAAPVPVVRDDIEVLESAADPGLVGRHFRVDDVSVGGVLPAARRLSVTGVEPGPNSES